MRELAIRIRFTKHCLGHVKKFHWVESKKRSYFLMPRNPDGRVVFLPTWWRTILVKAADVLCRHQEDVKSVRFSLEVDGAPRPIPGEFYYRHYKENRFSKHEAFFPGDVVGLTCIVPEAISDDDFTRLLSLAGTYYGISPARPNEFGHFTVVSVQPNGFAPGAGRQDVSADSGEATKNVNSMMEKVEPPVA